MPTALMRMPIRIAAVKDLDTLMAVADGITIKAETNKDPTIGIITEIATPVMIEKPIDIHLTGSPAVWAVASSKVKT